MLQASVISASLKRKLAAMINEEIWDDELEVLAAAESGMELMRQHSERQECSTVTRQSWGGSRLGKKPNKSRNFDAAFEKLHRQYGIFNIFVYYCMLF